MFLYPQYRESEEHEALILCPTSIDLSGSHQASEVLFLSPIVPQASGQP